MKASTKESDWLKTNSVPGEQSLINGFPKQGTSSSRLADSALSPISNEIATPQISGTSFADISDISDNLRQEIDFTSKQHRINLKRSLNKVNRVAPI